MSTVTELLAHAILDELRQRRAYLDKAEALSSVTVTVRFRDRPTTRVWSVEVSDQRNVAHRSGGRSEGPQ